MAARASVSEGTGVVAGARVPAAAAPPLLPGQGARPRGSKGTRLRPAPPPRLPRLLPPELLLLLRLAGGELGHRLGALRHGVLGQLACRRRGGARQSSADVANRTREECTWVPTALLPNGATSGPQAWRHQQPQLQPSAAIS